MDNVAVSIRYANSRYQALFCLGMRLDKAIYVSKCMYHIPFMEEGRGGKGDFGNPQQRSCVVLVLQVVVKTNWHL